MKIDLITCAETVVQDVRNNSLNLINIFEEISSPAFPLLIPKIHLVTILSRDPTDDQVLVARLVLRLNSATVLDQNIEIDFQGKSRFRAIAELRGYVLSETGLLKAEITLPNNQGSASWNMPVIAVGAPPADLFTGATGPTGHAVLPG